MNDKDFKDMINEIAQLAYDLGRVSVQKQQAPSPGVKRAAEIIYKEMDEKLDRLIKEIQE